MAVNKKTKKLLQGMWDEAEDMPESSIPDGKYQFKILEAAFGMSSSDKPMIASEIEVVGGNEDFIGETLKIFDNLETGENMSWFKKKLNKLGIELPEDFDEIIDGSVSKEMTGIVFDGQAKSKDGFFNVYVNKVVSKEDSGEEEESEESTEEETIEKKDLVTFTFKGEKKEGEVLEVLEDEEKIRIKEDKTNKKFKVAADKVELKFDEGEESEESEEGEEEESSEESNFPSVKEVKKFKKDDAIEALQALGIETDELKKPKDVCMTLAIVVEGEERVAKPDVIIALKAFGRKPKQVDKLVKLTKALSSEIDAALME